MQEGPVQCSLLRLMPVDPCNKSQSKLGMSRKQEHMQRRADEQSRGTLPMRSVVCR